MLSHQGTIGMFGHVSIRVPGTNRVFISPGASTEKTTVRPKDIFVFDVDGTIVEHPGGLVPLEWRIHTHAPVAIDPTGPVGTTQQQASTLLSALGRASGVRHVEVETYCWSVVPAERRASDVVEGIVRELAWVTGHVTAVAKSA
jgi:ribulose-5-phosphate 4-epimerase/fuculose-1-phosphate aldolase